MSFFKTKNALAKAEFRGFGGIDTKDVTGRGGKAADIVNFRVLPDGTLKKRCGYRRVASMPGKIRAMLTGYFDGEFLGYVLADGQVFKLDFATGERTLIGSIGSISGDASIFYYLGNIFVIDGEEIYQLKEDEAVSARGYVPLFGKNWGSNYPGEINEPINLLDPRARISYIVSDPPTIFLATLYDVVSVEAVYLNDILLSPDKYVIDSDFKTINVTGLEAGDRVLVYLTFHPSVANRAEFVSNTNAVVFGGVNNSRVFMWGGEKKNVMYSSAHVTNSSLRESQAVYPDSTALYFPAEYDFTVGDGRYDITAVSRHYDRLLIFTSGDTWMADSDACGTEYFPTMRINSENGCLSPKGCAKIGNDPISVGRGRIMKWTANTDRLEECNAYSVSDGIGELLTDSFFKSAAVHEDKWNGELLFANSKDKNGRVFVYRASCDSWYTYEGIGADIFFDGPSSVGFTSGKDIFLFDDELCEDKPSDSTSNVIEATFVSQPLDFGLSGRTKRLMMLNMEADLGGENIEVSFSSDKGIKSGGEIADEKSSGMSSYNKRIQSDRFTRTSMVIESRSSAPQKVYGVKITVKP